MALRTFCRSSCVSEIIPIFNEIVLSASFLILSNNGMC